MAQVVLNGHPTYAREPRGQGEPVLLLHGGLSSSASIWRRVGPYLRRSYEVHAFDRRGHGRTADTDAPFSYEDMANETIAYLERIGRRTHLVGHSDGGNVALLVARDRPDLVGRVVVVGANFHHSGLVPFAPFTPESAGFEEFALDFAATSPDGYAHAAAVVEKSRVLIETGPTMDARDLARIEAPVLVVVGDDDVISFEHTVALYEGLGEAQLCVVPAASHSVMKERPREVRAAIGRFLSMELPPVTMAPMRRSSLEGER